MSKKKIFVIVAVVIFSVTIVCLALLISNASNKSNLETEFFENIDAFENAAQYMIRTEGKVIVDKQRDSDYGFTEETAGPEYKPSMEEKEAIDIILYELNFRCIYRKTSGDIMIIKESKNGLEKGIVKLYDTEFPSGVVDNKHLQGNWYIYVIANF